VKENEKRNLKNKGEKKREAEVLGENLHQHQFVHHKSHIT
jgi:hypothetical protein